MYKQNVCRLCSIKPDVDDYLEIFTENGKRLRIAAIISQHFWFEITEPVNVDCLEIICRQCWIRLSDFHQFYIDIEKVRGHISVDNVKVEVEEDSQIVEDSSILLTAENLDESVDKSIKSRLRNTKTDRKCDDKICKFKEGRTNRSKLTRTIDLRLNKIVDNSNQSIDESLSRTNTEQIVNLTYKDKKDQEREKQNESFRNFFNMYCELCDEKLLTLDLVRKHYQTVHGESGYVTCCSKKFFNEKTMKQHLAEHVQPKLFQCEYCQKGYPLKRRLRYHLLTIHIDPENRPFKCEQCDRKFIKNFQLKVHQRTHSNNVEKKFGCDECEKRFISQFLLQSHKIHVHGIKNSIICEICAKGFVTNGSYLAHKRIIHDKAMPQVKCEICGTWLANRYNLKKHMKNHTDGKQTCQYCFRILKNRRSLQKHCSDLHSPQRKLFKCNLCSKEYRQAFNLQEHMSSHVGIELYSCSLCPATFSSSKHMYKHRKTIHPNVYMKIKVKGSVGLPPISIIHRNHEDLKQLLKKK